MANHKNSTVQLVTVGTKKTIPDDIQPAGQTMSTTDIFVVGVGTSFTTQLAPGAWIVNLTANEIRKVDQVIDNNNAVLTEPFTVNIVAGTQYDYIPLYFIKEISCVGDKAGAYEIDGVTMFAGTSISWGKNSNMRTALQDFIDPIIVNATAAAVIVETLRYS